MTRFVTDLLTNRSGGGIRAPLRDEVFDTASVNTWHCQQERVNNDVCADVNTGCWPTPALQQRKHACPA